ncbi:LuxR C-terminal-related transcriptional regulator [Pseudomonas sp. H9]|uniref:LuxR C-terminal-related transcriptional regulator n=1 Tax=Pseudomonas sp. H9 TaxID=483968 RepID=UPI00140471E8|nr:LuxR C-terminal-related transcriptional regulator [Pseudomonas sp. H9]
MLSNTVDRAVTLTKYSRAPELPSAHMARPRLIERLAAQPKRLVLLWAPAGYGKSALLTEYFSRSTEDLVWLDLGARPLSVEQFLARLTLALGLPPRSMDSEASLLERLRLRRSVLRLVLDDFPVQVSDELSALIDRLLGHSQILLHLYVTSRQRPDWQLPRLLLADDLLELDAKALAFNVEELRCLQLRQSPDASMAQSQALWQRTQGWCAGARFLLAADGNGEEGERIADEWLKDYLEQAWLKRIEGQECTALIELAHLPECSAMHCEQLWEGQQGAQMFTRLQKAHSFLFQTEGAGGNFRLLPLVAQALKSMLGNSARKLLYLRACRLYHGLGQSNAAIELALLAGRPDVAASYLEHISLEWLISECNLALLLRWKEQIPEELLHSTPRLLCLFARALLISWRLDEAAACIDNLGKFLPLPDKDRCVRLLANLQALSGALAALRADNVSAKVHCHEAIAYLPAEDWRSSVWCHSTLARVAMSCNDMATAEDHLHQAIELGRRNASLTCELMIDVDVIRLHMHRGEMAQARATLEQSFEHARGQEHQRLLIGRLRQLRAELHLSAGHLDECAEDLHASEQHARDVGDPWIFQVLVSQAQLASRRDEGERALKLLRDAQRLMQCGRVPKHLFQPVLDAQYQRLAESSPMATHTQANKTEVLTFRETAVLKLLAQGLTNKEIGSQLFISLNTVKTHTSSVKQKLGVVGRTRAVMRAQALGLLV